MFFCIEGFFEMNAIMTAATKSNTKFLMIVDYVGEEGLYISVKCDNKPEPVQDANETTHEWTQRKNAMGGA